MLHETIGAGVGSRPGGRLRAGHGRSCLRFRASRQAGDHGHRGDVHHPIQPDRGVAAGPHHLSAARHAPGQGARDVRNLTLPVPSTATCSFQADVKVEVTGTSTFVMYSSAKAVVPGCGGGTGTRFTPGYWKNHEAATTALLPQSLGGYTVSTFADAVAVFDAMKCSDAVNCLAGHLLAAQLDVANGSSACIAGTISDANAFLTSVGYAGPASYTISASQRAQALSLEQTLDNYTNDSTSATC